MSFQVPLTLRPVWRFCIHVVIGSFAFLIVYMIAVGVDRWVDWTSSHGAHRWMVDDHAGSPLQFSGWIFSASHYFKETIKLCRHIVLRDWDD